ncbi:MAG: PAS domain-containing protein [Desulfuromonadaceae bacterium]|nr:PAS domain-containing protein [Desulfuromonadaceae bacterium]
MGKPRLTLQEYEALIEQSPILSWRANPDALCDYFNDRWLSFRGRSMEEEYGNGWAEGVHPDDFDRCLKIYLDAFKAREIFEMEYRLKRYDGEYRWIFDRGVPFQNKNGEFAGYIGSCIDVTDRVVAQEALRRKLEEEIKTLKGIIPICAYCHKIRNDREIWQQMESYISEHSEALFSHGMCPECSEKEMQKIRSKKTT